MNKRSKSESQLSPYFRCQGRTTSQDKHPIKTFGQAENNQGKIPQNCGAHKTTSRKCEYCINQKKYPNYLHELRRERLQKEKAEKKLKKEMAEAYMGSLITGVPMVESHKMSQQIINQFSLEDKKLMSKQSNQLSEYEHEQEEHEQEHEHEHEHEQPANISFANEMIGSHSHSRKEIEKSLIHKLLQKEQQVDAQKEDFCFEIQVHSKGAIYTRKFTALEYGVKAVACIEEILQRNY